MQEMLPLIGNLPARCRNQPHFANRRDLAAIEAISSFRRFHINDGEIGINGQKRRYVEFETLQLRMMPVSTRFTAQYLPRQQSLAPQRYQPLRVEVLGMQRP